MLLKQALGCVAGNPNYTQEGGNIMPREKNNPNAVLLVEVDVQGNVIWAYDYTADKLNEEISIDPESKASNIIGSTLKVEGMGLQSGVNCVWKKMNGYYKCV